MGEWNVVAQDPRTFGVDLYELELAAKSDFPAISGDYGKAIDSCGQARSAVEGVMCRPEYFGSDTLGPVYPAYLELNDTVVGFLQETRTNLDLTATALDKAAQLFAATDAGAADEFNKQIRKNHPEWEGKR